MDSQLANSVLFVQAYIIQEQGQDGRHKMHETQGKKCVIKITFGPFYMYRTSFGVEAEERLLPY